MVGCLLRKRDIPPISRCNVFATIHWLNPSTKTTREFAVRNRKTTLSAMTSGARGSRGLGALGSGLLCAGALAATGFAHAQSAAAPAAAHDDNLTFHGITLYGIVDVGIQNQTHGAPISDYFVGGSAEVVQKNSNHPVTGITPMYKELTTLSRPNSGNDAVSLTA